MGNKLATLTKDETCPYLAEIIAVIPFVRYTLMARTFQKIWKSIFLRSIYLLSSLIGAN